MSRGFRILIRANNLLFAQIVLLRLLNFIVLTIMKSCNPYVMAGKGSCLQLLFTDLPAPLIKKSSKHDLSC